MFDSTNAKIIEKEQKNKQGKPFENSTNIWSKIK